MFLGHKTPFVLALLGLVAQLTLSLCEAASPVSSGTFIESENYDQTGGNTTQTSGESESETDDSDIDDAEDDDDVVLSMLTGKDFARGDVVERLSASTERRTLDPAGEPSTPPPRG